MSKPSQPFPHAGERRRAPRFSCSGQAKIISLPSNGIFLPGQLRDLSLGGCRIETVSPLACGAQAEILVHVNSSSFRAVGQVRAVRNDSGISIEFVRLSAGGRDMLEALVTELARLQVASQALRTSRQEVGADLIGERLRRGNLEGLSLRERFPVLGQILPADPPEGKTEAGADPGHLVIACFGNAPDAEREAETLDFFI